MSIISVVFAHTNTFTLLIWKFVIILGITFVVTFVCTSVPLLVVLRDVFIVSFFISAFSAEIMPIDATKSIDI